MNETLTINIIANAALGPLLSGGDNIFIECARRWAQMGHKINIFVWEEGLQMCERKDLTGVNFILWPAARFKKFGFLTLYFARIVIGCIGAWKYNFKSPCIIYSASDFWPDSIPAFIMKLRNQNVKWIAGFYLFAPAPLLKNSPYKGKRWFTGLIYWLTQKPCYWIIKRYADMVFVTSEPDVKRFITKQRCKDKIVVVRGGVDIKPSEGYLKSGKITPVEEKKYDACFVGRFHPQKGVLELIDIWELVCKEKPNARLSMIGSGPLEADVKTKVDKLGLSSNIELLGFKDGNEKYEVFKLSKIVVHPATYDSGGMSACEAMAWGLPGVSFDLEALKTYYPKGMVKTPCYDKQEFAENILRLLDGGYMYDRLSKDALGWAREWGWEVSSREILEKVKAICQ